LHPAQFCYDILLNGPAQGRRPNLVLEYFLQSPEQSRNG
jgi:hypothetical protein